MHQGALVYAGIVLYLPVLLWVGIRSWGWVAVLYAAIAVASGASAVVGLHRAPGPRWVLFASAGSAVMVAATGLVLGPFVIQPTFAAVNVMAFSFLLDRRDRWVVLALGILAVAVPIGLGWVGLRPAPFDVVDGAVILQSSMLQLDRVPTLVLLAATSIANIAVTSYFVGRLRDGLSSAERKLAVQAWSLRQLLPDRA